MQSADGMYYVAIDQRGRGRTQYAHGENLVAGDRNIVISDGENAGWSALGGPAPAQADSIECRQEPGRSTFIAQKGDIRATTVVCVDPTSYREVTRVTIENTGHQPASLRVTATHDVMLRGHDNNMQLDHTEFDKDSGAILARRYHGETAKHRYSAYFVGDRAPSSWCGSAQDFAGSDVPLGQEAGWSGDSLTEIGVSSTDPFFALRYDMAISPSSTETLHVVLGIAETIEESAQLAKQSPASAAQVLTLSRDHYAQILSGHRVATPDPAIDLHANFWSRVQLKHQTVTGRRGIDHNWRNNLQDAMGWLHIDPGVMRSRLLEVSALAEEDGFIRRSSPKMPSPDARLKHLQSQKHNDIATWFGLAVAKYVLETGDHALLHEMTGQHSVLETVDRGLMWTFENIGAHGLVLFLDGDWSDPLEAAGREGKGESVWTSMAVVNAVQHLAPILDAIGESERSERLRRHSEAMTKRINEHAWDESWYIRGFTDAGTPFCTRDEDGGRVAMLMQAWAILSNVATPERAAQVLDVVEQRCLTPHGAALYDPAFLYERADLGRESAKRPGTAENGSCYTHGSMMLANAALQAGRSDLAYRLVKAALPLQDLDNYETRMGSPLWWSNYYQGPYGAAPGRSSNHISSGAVAWFLMNLAEGFLGIQPTLDGLRIRPQFPDSWSTAELHRRWRGADYHFRFKRGTASSVVIDGHHLPDGVIPPPTDAGPHLVEVTFT